MAPYPATGESSPRYRDMICETVVEVGYIGTTDGANRVDWMLLLSGAHHIVFFSKRRRWNGCCFRYAYNQHYVAHKLRVTARRDLGETFVHVPESVFF